MTTPKQPILPSRLDIPPPFKMAPNAWEVGYYDGYTNHMDQNLWSSDLKLQRDEYRNGWCEGKDYKTLEVLAKANRRRRTPPR